MSIDLVLASPHIEPLVEWAIRILEDRHPGTAWAVSGASLQCRKSRVIPMCERAGPRRAGLKIYHEPRAADRQAAGLRYAAQMNTRDGYGAPVLYDCDPAASALLVEWVAEPHLERVLIRAATSPGRYRQTISRTGEWLRRFHAIDGIAPALFDASRYIELLLARMEAAPEGTRRLQSDALWQRSRMWLSSTLGRLQGSEVPFARTHGDFTFTNVLVSPERVIGIDIWADRRLPLAEDLARMFVYLAMGDITPVRARFASVALAPRRAQQALLRGYGGLDAGSSAVWEALVCFEALARWIALEDRLARKGSLPDVWKRAGLRGVLTGIVGEG